MTRKPYVYSGLAVLVLGILATVIAVPLARRHRTQASEQVVAGSSLMPSSVYSSATATTTSVTLPSSSPSSSIARPSPGRTLVPVISADFPDPAALQVNGTWYAFGTTNGKQHVQVATSPDFRTWTVTGQDALPSIGEWETDENHWAPQVIQRGDGKFVMYYSGTVATSLAQHCVGVAVSRGNDPAGPYMPQDTPLACPLSVGGAIDPSGFIDSDGTNYIVYKVDGNSIGHGGACNNGIEPMVPTPILLQKLHTDGVSPLGPPIQILDRDTTDGPLVEAPNLIRTRNGSYFLFFSSNCYTTPNYNVNYAVAPAIDGPYVKASEPLLVTGDFDLTAPGGGTVTSDGLKIVFHADCQAGRCMFAEEINIEKMTASI